MGVEADNSREFEELPGLRRFAGRAVFFGAGDFDLRAARFVAVGFEAGFFALRLDDGFFLAMEAVYQTK
jgi:hypothetical protein